ncbi:succinylglutamate desuccinylase/aspartoacylase family protein [Aestuariispira insulae]|uniref:Succinylglutamate desuccinylase/Aspartoacylase catalytic domain-containing protein n=1 Tax=Aestuariispira insulae TaxID=1461337 RepID=A0A3D9HJR1_9PROT|nr:succinylglutamate desuccinylase/aspartoacylase family protein [Aestuariispira insulae]RED49730.1 hypothetical protein DFP90_105101 [Aestuariispira insulae]
MVRADSRRRREAFEIAGEIIPAGERRTVDIPLGVLSTQTPMTLPVHVIHGKRPGPVLFVSAAIHGDEVLGVEIIRRLLQMKQIAKPRGTLLLVPVVNVYGFISHTRYLPDRRDLNRCFPGSTGGSLASKLAHVFMEEVVRKADYGIDLHTAGMHRSNLPQIRVDFDDEVARRMARAFGAPVTLNSNLRDGSLRQAAQEEGVHTLLFEAGEALRFEEGAIRHGVKGVLRVLHDLGIISGKPLAGPKRRPVLSRSSHWLRAPTGGILRMLYGLGEAVQKGEVIAVVSGPFGDQDIELRAKTDGIVIGRTNLPVVNQGDAVFHVARVFDPEKAEANVDSMEQDLIEDPLFDEEIV